MPRRYVITAFAALAAADICAGMNPVPVDAAALERILEAAL